MGSGRACVRVCVSHLLELELSASPGVGILIQACDEQAPDGDGIHG